MLYKNVIVLHVFDSTSGFVHLLGCGHISNSCVIFHRNIIYATSLPLIGRQVVSRTLLLETVAKTSLTMYLYIFVSSFLLFHESSRILVLKPISS